MKILIQDKKNGKFLQGFRLKPVWTESRKSARVFPNSDEPLLIQIGLKDKWQIDTNLYDKRSCRVTSVRELPLLRGR